jgi:hypothetical protein
LIPARNRVVLAVGVIGVAVLALSTTASLGGFTASITNTGDKVATGSLLMQEETTPTGGATTTCLSTAGGAGITTNANAACVANKFRCPCQRHSRSSQQLGCRRDEPEVVVGGDVHPVGRRLRGHSDRRHRGRFLETLKVESAVAAG